MPGLDVRPRRGAAQHGGRCDPERVPVVALEAAAIHRGERCRDAHRVGAARLQRLRGLEAQRHRVAPLDPAGNRGLDREDRLRRDGGLQPAGHGPVEHDGDFRVRLCGRRRRHAHHAQRRGGGGEGGRGRGEQHQSGEVHGVAIVSESAGRSGLPCRNIARNTRKLHRRAASGGRKPPPAAPPDAGGGGDFGAWNEAGGRALAGGRLLTAALSAIIRRSRCVSADWPCTRDCRLSRTIMIGQVCQASIQ